MEIKKYGNDICYCQVKTFTFVSYHSDEEFIYKQENWRFWRLLWKLINIARQDLSRNLNHDKEQAQQSC